VCLLHVLFEDLGCAIEFHGKIANEDTELHSLDPRNYLFNGQEEGDYRFGQGITNEASIDDKEYLQLNESWCLFAYREFYKNLLVILDEVSLRTHGGKKISIPNRFCKLIDLHDDEKIHAFLMKLSKNTHSDVGLSYQTVMNNQSYTIHSGITQPPKFSLGNIPTMSSITDSVGEGWDDRKIANFFNERNNIVNEQEEVPMTRSKHFEHAYIISSMMTKIKLTTKKGKENLFTIECYTPSFEPQNETVCKQHAVIFKHDKFTFHPQKDLALSMPYQFVVNLELSQFTPLDKLWLKNVKKILKKAKLNSIEQIRLVRLSKMNYVGNRTMTFKNFNENVMYKAVTDTNDSSYLVTLDQIYDIVGEDDWIHGESNCLVNLASGQTITFSWGAKKKERKEQRRVLSDEGLQVGDHVFVENCGNQWPHKAQIVNIDMENNFLLIKWETTQNIAYVDLDDLKHFSMDNSAPRKQKSTDFYTPPSGKKIASTEQCQNYRSDLQRCTENMFYSEKNSSKLCTVGAIGNLMNVLHCPQNEVKQFWDIVQLPVYLILQTLGESSVPKVVLQSGGECDSIQKSLWILREKFKFSTTSLFQMECFKDLQEAITNLSNIKFPLIISVMGTHACYHHVVVIWRGMIIDYESKYVLQYDSLRQICDVNTTFAGISCGYGIFPPKDICNSMDNISIEDWGINKYNIKGSPIRKCFN
jgi:hypothetical protein